MKKIITILFFLAFFPLNLYPQWMQITSPTSNDLYTVFFMDASTGFVSGSLNGTIYKTIDGGASWNAISIDTIGTFYDMYFIDQQTGVIVGESKKIFKTTDEGNTWVLKTSNTSTLYSVSYYQNTYYAVGGNPTVVDKSDDGGETWTPVAPPTSDPLKGVWFSTENLGWACGDNGAIYKTIDGGASWISQVQSTNFEGIQFFGSNYGYVVGADGTLLRSSNGGTDWNPLTTNITSTLKDIVLFTSTYAWIAGGDGTVLKTSNGGVEWFQQTTATTNSLNALSIATIAVGYTVGDGGVILKTTNGGGPPIGVKSISNEIPANYQLLQNYPNPFNPTTRIKYMIPKSSFVTLTVYDNNGNEITKLVNALQSAGSYLADFKGENLSSGIYYYKLTADNFTASRKMVLVK
jgi:photosystem II stability/assembly factor-like uncharacterized protein